MHNLGSGSGSKVHNAAGTSRLRRETRVTAHQSLDIQVQASHRRLTDASTPALKGGRLGELIPKGLPLGADVTLLLVLLTVLSTLGGDTVQLIQLLNIAGQSFNFFVLRANPSELVIRVTRKALDLGEVHVLTGLLEDLTQVFTGSIQLALSLSEGGKLHYDFSYLEGVSNRAEIFRFKFF